MRADVCNAFFKTPSEVADEVQEHDSVHYLLGLNLPSDHQDAAEGRESLKARVNAIRNKLVQQVRQCISLIKEDLLDTQEKSKPIDNLKKKSIVGLNRG